MASIRKRLLPSGRVVWLVDFRDMSGRRRARQFSTKREADAFLVQARAAVAAGTYTHDGGSITLEEAARLWLGICALRCKAGRRMERATLQDYVAKVQLHILDPELGLRSVKLSRLSRRAINGFRDRLLASGRSEMMARKVLSCLSLIIKHAQDNGQISFNPVEGVRVLRSHRTSARVQVPTKEEIRRLIEASPDAFRSLLIVSALCGLRASETRGLMWEDVDFDAGLIHVRRRADAFNQLGEPKSAAGLRSVPMGPYVSQALKHWKLACPPSSLALTFPNRQGSIRTHTTVLKRHFKPLCRKLGVNLRWHDLRHFAVSLWIEQGFSIKEAMTFAGHSSIQMTMDRYGHLFPTPDHQRGMGEIETRLLG